MAEAGKGKGSDRPREKQQLTSSWSWLVEGIPILAQLLNLLEPYSLTLGQHQLESGIWQVVGPTANMIATQNVISGLGLKVPTSSMSSRIKSNSPFMHLDSICSLLNQSDFGFACPFLHPSCFFSAPNAIQVDSNEDPLECTASVLLPHEIFGALYDRDKRQVGDSEIFMFPITNVLVKFVDFLSLNPDSSMV